MPVIFISYRREDSAGHAGRIFDRLRERFGRDSVFLDVVGIDAGVDFVDSLDKAVGSCDVLLAVIGREWLTCCDKQARRRLDDPNDFIRAEISAALKRNVRVVPVLVEGAEMPPTDALPEELKRLTRRQAVELRDSRWDADVEALIASLEREGTRTGTGPPPPAAPAVRAEPAVQEESGRQPSRRGLFWGIGAVVALLIAAGAALFLWPRVESKPPPVVPSPKVEQLPVGPSPEIEQPQTSEPDTTPAGKRQDVEPAGESETEKRTVGAPELVGLSVEQAIERLRASGLKAGDQEAKQTAAAPARRVLSQWPLPGKPLDPGTAVDLVYAEPLPDVRVEIPDVVGADIRKAMETLRSAGFDFARQSEPSAEERNRVLRQEPAAGSRAEKGTRVTLVYAVPVVTGIAVPNVVGMEVREATATLRRAGIEGSDIVSRAEPSSEPRNKVLRQEPAAGSRVEKGARVTLVHALGTTVTIHYADEADRRTAEALARYLRSLRLPGIDYETTLSDMGLPVGKLFYSGAGLADVAKTIAGRSGYWLSKTYNRRVLIAPEHDQNIGLTALWLMMPGSR